MVFGQENFPVASVTQEKVEKARAIAREGGFDAVQSRLREEGLLDTVIEQTKNKYLDENSPHYEKLLFDAEFLTSQDWKILGMMELFDTETAEHEIHTFCLANEHLKKAAFVPVTKKNSGGKECEAGYSVTLNEIFEREGVTKEQFLRAALHHDIGKLDVPHSVLTNFITDGQWKHVISENIGSGDPDLTEKLSDYFGVDMKDLYQSSGSREGFENAIDELMKKEGCRPKDFVPIRYAVSKEITEELFKKGYPLDSTLADIIHPHEEKTGIILRKEGLFTEAELSEKHHNYKKTDIYQDTDINRPITIGTLRLSICFADIIHLVDFEEAVRAKRVYKEACGPFEAWSAICEIAEQGKVTKEAAYLWIKAEVDEMSQEEYEKNKEKHLDEEEHFSRFLNTEEDTVWKNLETFGYVIPNGGNKK
jgi:hypothetical protein